MCFDMYLCVSCVIRAKFAAGLRSAISKSAKPFKLSQKSASCELFNYHVQLRQCANLVRMRLMNLNHKNDSILPKTTSVIDFVVCMITPPEFLYKLLVTK